MIGMTLLYIETNSPKVFFKMLTEIQCAVGDVLGRIKHMETSVDEIKEELRAIKSDKQMVQKNVDPSKNSMAAIEVTLSAIQKNLKGQSNEVKVLVNKAMQDVEDISQIRITTLEEMDQACDRILNDPVYHKQLVNIDSVYVLLT